LHNQLVCGFVKSQTRTHCAPLVFKRDVIVEMVMLT